MKSYFSDWIRGYATWAAILLFLAAALSAISTNDIALTLVFFCLAVGFIIFRHWAAINTFEFWAIDEWARTRRQSFGIHEWYVPYQAAEHFCDPTIVRARNEAAEKMSSIMIKLFKGQNRNVGVPLEADLPINPEQEREALSGSSSAKMHAEYDAAQVRHDQASLLLSRDLVNQLRSGNLMAKGLPTQNNTTRSERIIPTSRWRIMNLDISKAEASGRELHYIGIVIGKRPGR